MLDADDLERLGQFERYKDVDGDGVCYRTIPGTEHPLAAYFTRGTGHNEKSGYSERPEDWKKNLDRLALKLETARAGLPAPVIEGEPRRQGRPDRLRRHPLGHRRGPRPAPRARASRPSTAAFAPCRSPTRSTASSSGTSGFTSSSRTATARSPRSLKSTLSGALADRLVPITHYNGTPIAAENIVRPILGWEKNPSGPGWPTGNVERDNPRRPPRRGTTRPNDRVASARFALESSINIRSCIIFDLIEAIESMASEATIHDPEQRPHLHLPTVAFQGLPSTLCKGCGHNSITSHLIEACKSIGVNPYYTVKISGIGCSSKTPAYFLQVQPRLQRAARPDAVGGDRRAGGQPQARCASASAATATRPTSAWASSSTSAGATCRWSTSSRTTAATA